MIGDAYENLARVDSDRTGTRTLMDKVVASAIGR